MCDQPFHLPVRNPFIDINLSLTVTGGNTSNLKTYFELFQKYFTTTLKVGLYSIQTNLI